MFNHEAEVPRSKTWDRKRTHTQKFTITASISASPVRQDLESDPNQVIDRAPPEGGGGPNYDGM